MSCWSKSSQKRINSFKRFREGEIFVLMPRYTYTPAPRVLEWRKNQKDAADYEEETKEEVQRLEEKIDKMEER